MNEKQSLVSKNVSDFRSKSDRKNDTKISHKIKVEIKEEPIDYQYISESSTSGLKREDLRPKVDNLDKFKANNCRKYVRNEDFKFGNQIKSEIKEEPIDCQYISESSTSGFKAEEFKPEIHKIETKNLPKDSRNKRLKMSNKIESEIKMEPKESQKISQTSKDCLKKVLKGPEISSHMNRKKSIRPKSKAPKPPKLYYIEVTNLPKPITCGTFKKLLRKLKIKFKKCYKIDVYVYTHLLVSFGGDKEGTIALRKLNHYLWLNKNLSVKSISRQEFLSRIYGESNTTFRLRDKIKYNHLSKEELSDALNDQICNFWKIPYNQQKQQKYDYIREVLCCIHSEITNTKSIGFPNIQLDNIRETPFKDGYQNMCNFVVGIDKIVGFRLPPNKVVVPSLNCPIIGDQMRNILNAFQKYINKSQFNAFERKTNSGNWIECTARTTTYDSMVIMRFKNLKQKQLKEKELREEKNKIIKFFENNTEFGVNSVYFEILTKGKKKVSYKHLELLFGNEYMFETIQLERSLKFRISPLASFHMNAIGAQILLESIEELIKPNPELIILDIYSGIGTIGLYLASKVKKVIAFELHSDSISDAKFNAESNGISNIQFIEGRAELKINEVLKSCGNDSNIVAVVDPPVVGVTLCNSMIQIFRSNSLLKQLVYISCDPQKAVKDLIDLCRLDSEGKPFLPIRVIPIDLFAHTDRCKLVILLQKTD